MKAETEPKNAIYKQRPCNCFSFSSQELIKVCPECAFTTQFNTIADLSPSSKLCVSQNSPGWFPSLQCDKPSETASLVTN